MMNRLSFLINKVLRSKRGESIMELLVAMLVFTISLTALTLIIRFSLNFTMTQIRESRESQDTSNIIIAGVEAGAPVTGTAAIFGIVILDDIGNPLFSAVHPVTHVQRVLNLDRTGETTIVAFYPNP